MAVIARTRVVEGALAARDALHTHDRQPAWMKSVFATAIGFKVYDGLVTNEVALQFVVAGKRPLEDIAVKNRIPKRVDGFFTDVLRARGEVELEMPAFPTDESRIISGASLVTEAGSVATLGCTGTNAGESVCVTAKHALDGLEQRVSCGGQDIGIVVAGRTKASRDELYGSNSGAPPGPFLIDIGIIKLYSTVTVHDGLPGGRPYQLVPASRIAKLMDTRVLARGAGSNTIRSGVVVGIWPRSTTDDIAALCLVQQSPTSEKGDSGGLWLTQVNGQFIAVGKHWGQVRKNASAYALVTDLGAACSLMGIDPRTG